ncbi:hypothetical protein RJ639_004701 [Escallonia herrerae]|uniref:VASt domain-containing protein n=1 Tax=Escallonia herrerae TaxID=1293975 RepID=A0AA88W0I0_9ASTE|nr:hypothetical protein RJ639_004701 [Escallonia herrerae]
MWHGFVISWAVGSFCAGTAQALLDKLKVVEFFSLFFSDDSIDFHELFHRKCGDKDFKCTSWYAHDKFGHARDVSFQHPIKLYFGARFGSCQEIQKYRVYRSSHLVVDTSQVISDVPYGDYFCVEGLWDVKQDGDESTECCVLRVYTNVAFSKKTMWKGKIVQSTVEECRDAYAIWIDLAHEFLKQKDLEKQEEAGSHEANLVANTQAIPERQENFGEQPEISKEQRDPAMPGLLPDSNDVDQPRVPLRRSISSATSVASLLRDSLVKFCLSLKSGSQVPAFALAVVAIIFLLMQISIIMLLARPQQIHVVPQAHCVSIPGGEGERGSETMLFLDKQISHLKEEMLIVETLLGKMQHEHSLLKRQLNDLVLLREQHR